MHTLLAQLIARREGYYVTGSPAQRNNNPGNLRHGVHEIHPPDSPDCIGSFATAQEGWDALERQLSLYANRGEDLQQAIYTYAPPSDDNNTDEYLNFVCQGLGCTPDVPVTDALKIE